ncbi:unnamed protein product [Vicia faba]|uniref:Uncharacterized protein n=1 Tax=Vicia faba TaxID=3906 RepID=A0AAV0ZID5_VICFA|nr:unnamed protein product [Vicia faba]
MSITSQNSEVVDLKSLKKDKVVPKAGSTSSLKVSITTTENPPSDQEDDSSKKKKESGLPPKSPKKQKHESAHSENESEKDEDISPLKRKKKKKVNKSGEGSQLANPSKNKVNVTAPKVKSKGSSKPQSSKNVISECIGSNATSDEQKSAPFVLSDPPAIQGQASKLAASSQPEGFNEAVLNKGSSTAATPAETIEVLDQQATSPPLVEALDQQATSPPLTEGHVAGERYTTLETLINDNPSDSSPRRVHFANQSEEESDTHTVSRYFADGDEDEIAQEEVEVPVPTGTIFTKNPDPPILTGEQKEELKWSNPLKYIKLMLAQRDSSSSKNQSEDSSQIKDNAPLTSLDQLIQQVSSEYIRVNDAEAKIRSKQESLSKAYDQTSKLSEEAEKLERAKIQAQDKHDVLARSIMFWESQIEELKKKIEGARNEKAALKFVDDQELENLVTQSLQQMEVAEGIIEEIKGLENVRNTTQCKINLCKSKFAKLKRNAPF